MRQEIDGPQAEQLESVPCGQTLQDEDNSRSREELRPAWIRDKETTYFLFLRSRRPPRLHVCRKAPRGQKGRGHHPIIGGVNLPIGLCTRIHILVKRCARMSRRDLG